MTYCERTDHDKYALHINGEELSEIKSSLTENNVSVIARKLRKIIARELVADHVGVFLKDRKIELCEKCGGSGKIRVNVTGTYEYDFETCTACQGKTGRVKITTTTYEPLTELWQEHFAK